MFTVDISLETLTNLINDVKKVGGNAIRFTVYDSNDGECGIVENIATCGLIRPKDPKKISYELKAGSGSFYPKDWV